MFSHLVWFRKIVLLELDIPIDFVNVQVSRLRLLGDQMHSTRIAFVEFLMVCYLFLL